MIQTTLAIATLLGGVSAIWFFWDKLKLMQLFRWTSLRRFPAIPLDRRSLFAYANGSERLHALTRKVAATRGFEVRPIDGESAWLNEKIAKMQIPTVRDLDSYVMKYGDAAAALTNYVTPQGPIDNGFVLGMVVDIMAIERGGQEGIRELNDGLKFSSGGRAWADEMFEAYHQIRAAG